LSAIVSAERVELGHVDLAKKREKTVPAARDRSLDSFVTYAIEESISDRDLEARGMLFVRKCQHEINGKSTAENMHVASTMVSRI
jgi:hypothetical protein